MNPGARDPSLILQGVKFGFLSAFDMQEDAFHRWRESPADSTGFNWIRPGQEMNSDASQEPDLRNTYRTVQRFLTEKMLFIAKTDPVPSLRAERGVSTHEHQLTFGFGNEEKKQLSLNLRIAVTYFRDSGILTAFIFGSIDSITLDHLIFLKQTKWYEANSQRGWSAKWVDSHARCKSIRELIATGLESRGATGLSMGFDENWPVFDFIELADVGPAATVGSHPKQPRRLTEEEHWGLLSGDEGYRLTDRDDKAAFRDALIDKVGKFSSRSHFLYHFAPTSCIAFMSPSMGEIKNEFADRYRKEIGRVDMLDSYIRLTPPIPCMADGIPIVVESCLIRFVELRRSARTIEQEIGFRSKTPDAIASGSRIDRLWQGISYFIRAVRNMIRRPFSPTPLEAAVHTLSRLDLYQDSNILWIIGGPYTDNLFNYSAIRLRIEPAIRNIQSMQSELTRTLLAGLAVFLTVCIGLIGVLLAYHNRSEMSGAVHTLSRTSREVQAAQDRDTAALQARIERLSRQIEELQVAQRKEKEDLAREVRDLTRELQAPGSRKPK